MASLQAGHAPRLFSLKTLLSIATAHLGDKPADNLWQFDNRNEAGKVY